MYMLLKTLLSLDLLYLILLNIFTNSLPRLYAMFASPNIYLSSLGSSSIYSHILIHDSRVFHNMSSDFKSFVFLHPASQVFVMIVDC